MTLSAPDLEAIADRDNQIVALARQDVRPRDISARLGVSPAIVYDVLRTARRRGEGIRRFTTSGRPTGLPTVQTYSVQIQRTILDDLRPHASVRGVSTTELARKIIELVVEWDLVNAVLDDGVRAKGVPFS